MPSLILIDTVLRSLTIGELLLIALVIGRGNAPRAIRSMTALLLLGVAAYLVVAAPGWGATSSMVRSLMQLLAQSVPLLLWVFAQQLFERPIDRRLVAVGLVALFGCWAGFRLVADVAAARFAVATVQRVISIGFIAHAITIAITARGDDLVEKRRRLRSGFVVVVGLGAAAVLLIEFPFGFNGINLPVGLAQAAMICAATTAMGAALLQSDPDILFDPARPTPEPRFSPVEHVLNQKLEAAMAAALYRAPGLTIGVLAERLGTPEHRLRALINQRLGYRNFSGFINHHRIGEAKMLLADPAHVDLPILTIAMDLGYGSLAPFNRAFRDAVGQPPSEFRRAAILQP